MSENDMGSIFDLIRQWARDRNLVEGSNPQAQMLKLFEEGGELAHAIARNNYDGVMDSIGDMVVVLTILAAQFDANIEEDCIAPAYDTIKDRKGRMVDGVFVKADQNACQRCGYRWEGEPASFCDECNAEASVQEQAFLETVLHGQSGVVTSQDGTERLATPEELAKFTAAREAIENNWQPHDGGPMPCDGDTYIEVQFRCGEKSKERAYVWHWAHDGDDYDIISWRVV